MKVGLSSLLSLMKREAFANKEKNKKREEKRKSGLSPSLTLNKEEDFHPERKRDFAHERKRRCSKWAAEALRAEPLILVCFESVFRIVERLLDVWLSK